MVSRFFLETLSKEAGTLCLVMLLVLALFAMSGCAVTGGGGRFSTAPAEPADLAAGDVIETESARRIGFEEMIGKLSGASVVYAGETHTSMEDHRAQLEILRRLAERGGCIELGMEMFPRAAQPVLDTYIRGEMPEGQFLKEVRWDEVWGFPYELYRGLIDFAKSRNIRVIGLNAPHQVVRRIARVGLSGLDPGERSQVSRDFHLDDPKDRRRVQNEYEVHGKDRVKDFESFYEAQLAWEETMAETLAGRLQATSGKCRIIVILGKGHMRNRLGVPHLTALRVPHEFKTVAPIPVDYPSSVFDPNIADYVLLTEKSEAVHRPRIGVAVQPAASGGGAEILGVIPDTPAEKSGLRKGDVIVSIDGAPVGGVEDIQRALAGSGPSHRLEVLRGKKRRTIEITVE